MKAWCSKAVAVIGLSVAYGEDTNPLGKVLELLGSLEQKVIKEGEAEAKIYNEYAEWCEDTAKNDMFSIKTATSQKAKLEANIAELKSISGEAESKVSDLAASIANADKELKDATTIRAKEAKDFKAEEAELTQTIQMLEMAQEALQKGGSSLLQTRSTEVKKQMQALASVVNAAGLSAKDSAHLQALLQAQSSSAMELDDMSMGAPAAAVYESKGGGILDLLSELAEKAEGQLSDLRKAEVNTAHNFKMLVQSLTDQKKTDTDDMDNTKARKASAEEESAKATGDLKETVADLTESKENLETVRSDCMRTAADHEASVAARTEEVKVLAEAFKIIKETTSGAEKQSYSFTQVHLGIRSRTDLAKSEVVTLIRNLAKLQHSAALQQLSTRVAAFAQMAYSGRGDAFAKIKGMIQDMIRKLEKEANEEATEKAYCDEQMSRTEAKKTDLDGEISKMTAKLDQSAARSAELKEQVQVLETELAALARSQAEMDQMRHASHEEFVIAKQDLELGLSGVQKALNVLRDFYATGSTSMIQEGVSASMMDSAPAAPGTHSKSSGAGGSIIGLLEVVESDFASGLAKEQSEEDDAQSIYEKTTQENSVTRTTKEQDVKYKNQESKSLDKTISEINADLETSNNELSAVMEYYSKIKARCVAKPETYEERKQRREAEISGLKEALSVLEDETAFVQRNKRRGNIRGALVP